jgi:N-acetylmuramoyl-L-alanine amidase CwlA
MRSETQQAGRRRRGGRRHKGPRGSYNNHSHSGNGHQNGSQREAAAPQKKLGFFQRLIAFFTGGKPKTPSRSSGSVSTSAPTTAAPARKPEVQQKPARKPELVEVTSAKIYVGNLSFDATESDLFELFNGVGEVRNAEVVSHRETQKSKGFAFVTMSSVDEAKRAVLELHDKEFMGRRLVVSGAKTSDVREPRHVAE